MKVNSSLNKDESSLIIAIKVRRWKIIKYAHHATPNIVCKI